MLHGMPRIGGAASLLALALATCGPTPPRPAGHTRLGDTPLPSVRDDRTQVVFVLVPAGEFTMGGAGRDELPRHRVRLTEPFWLAQTEITAAQWRTFVAVAGNPTVPLPPEGDDAPIHVSFDEATAYCRHFGYELPTEAQWERAARAGDDAVPATIDLAVLLAASWFHHNAGLTPMPVATRRANAFGLHDMLGNVWEWCADVYAPYAASDVPAVDPRGPAAGTTRVLRGGSWFSLPPALPWTRAQELPGHRSSCFGFRPACKANMFGT